MRTAGRMALATVAFALLHSALASRAAKQAVADGPFLRSRHPLNVGGMPIFRLTPHLTARRRAFKLASSACFIPGSLHGEARLIAACGERCRRYRRGGVPLFWPRPPALRHARRGAGHAH